MAELVFAPLVGTHPSAASRAMRRWLWLAAAIVTQTMSFAPGALEFLFGAGPVAREATNIDVRPPQSGRGVSSLPSAQPAADSPQPAKKKRRHAKAKDLEGVLNVACCRGSSASKFVDLRNSDYRLDLLTAERKRFLDLGPDEPARKNFVAQRVPIQEQHKSKLYAGNRLVCGKFFKSVFPASNNLICAAKGTPGSRTSANVSVERAPRRGQHSPKRDVILAFVDWYSGIFGQRMPNKPWTTLYTATKGVSKSCFFTVVSLLGVGGRIPIAPQTAACVPALLCGGSNLVCTALWLALKRLSAMWAKPGQRFYIKRLHLQLHNCVGEKKNNIVLAFIGGLVAAGVVVSAEVCFLIVGHTLIKIDHVFSRFSVGTLGRSIFTRSQLGELFRESYKELPVHVGTLTNLGNFKGLYLDDNKLNLRKIRNITTFRAFRVGKVAGEVSVWAKRFMHSDAWLGLTATGGAQVDDNPHRLFRFAAPTFDNVPPFELKTVDPTVIALIEKRYIATRPRLEAAYALAPDGVVDALLAEQSDSLKLLRSGGTINNFDLPMEWLHTAIPPAPLPPSAGATADGVDNTHSRANRVSEPSKRKALTPVRPTSLTPPSVGDIAFLQGGGSSVCAGGGAEHSCRRLAGERQHPLVWAYQQYR
ncbi:unnamed protein product [Ectocarpus sp. CCAP 1310/34]|nr:unnamed protein product [Ectocarpus sp. CCAP 1310/34]